MIVRYKNKKIERVCTDYNWAVKKYNSSMANYLKFCIQALQLYNSVEEIVNDRVRGCHPLKQNRTGQYSMHLQEPYRLIFEKDDDDGTVHIVMVEEIVDYH